MSRYNLIDEKWINVISLTDGSLVKVGLADLFRNAHNYYDVYGDTKSQDFAITRLLLSVLHTVFSRYDANGKKHDEIETDKKMIQIEDVYEEDYEDYKEELLKTWVDLWNGKKFPQIVLDYLNEWKDSFYLYDDKRPFYQIPANIMQNQTLKSSKKAFVKNPLEPNISGRSINLKIGESQNKASAFSLVSDIKDRDIFEDDQVARWLISYNSFCGASDKRFFADWEDYGDFRSYGWGYQLGGILIKGNNLFETLLLNLVLFNPYTDDSVNYSIERPCWEKDPLIILEDHRYAKPIKSRADLYTNYARAIYIDPEFKSGEPLSIAAVKLRKVDDENNFVEAMTIYRQNKTLDRKIIYRPKKHEFSKSLWRSFELLTNRDYNDNTPKPGVIKWLSLVEDCIELENIKIAGVSLEDDGNVTSRRPTNDIYDIININLKVFNDNLEDGWVDRLISIINNTQKKIDFYYKNFVINCFKIKNIDDISLANKKVEEVYILIDSLFKTFISEIKPESSKDKAEVLWNEKLNKIVLEEANRVLRESGNIIYRKKEFKDKNSKVSFSRNMIQLYNNLSFLLKRGDNE